MLYFYYGTMNSSKTSNLLMSAHNYKTQGKIILIMKPSIHVGEYIISRVIGKTQIDFTVSPTEDFSSFFNKFQCLSAIFIDEAQFLSKLNVESLKKLSVFLPIFCYGLKTDYKTNLFEGSKRLLEIADSIEEIKNVCCLCDKKAIINGKFIMNEGKKLFITEGTDEPDFGAEEKYQAVCWECWTR